MQTLLSCLQGRYNPAQICEVLNSDGETQGYQIVWVQMSDRQFGRQSYSCHVVKVFLSSASLHFDEKAHPT